MPNEQGRYNKEEVLASGLPYYIPRSKRWEGKCYSFAVLLTKSRCQQLGVPELLNGHEMPSAYLYVAIAGRGTNDLNHRYVGLYDRSDAWEILKNRLLPKEIMGMPPGSTRVSLSSLGGLVSKSD